MGVILAPTSEPLRIVCWQHPGRPGTARHGTGAHRRANTPWQRAEYRAGEEKRILTMKGDAFNFLLIGNSARYYSRRPNTAEEKTEKRPPIFLG